LITQFTYFATFPDPNAKCRYEYRDKGGNTQTDLCIIISIKKREDRAWDRHHAGQTSNRIGPNDPEEFFDHVKECNTFFAGQGPAFRGEVSFALLNRNSPSEEALTCSAEKQKPRFPILFPAYSDSPGKLRSAKKRMD
jgi:hypothetical protein